MGLDSYWYLRKNDFRYPEDRMHGEGGLCEYPKGIREIAEAQNVASISVTTDYTVCYFRKFNAMHSWIVDNCADGHDICQDINVYVDRAKDLLALCDEILAARNDLTMSDDEKAGIAREKLPPSEGFFFGTTVINDWYYKDVSQLSGFLSAAIAFLESEDGEEWELVYRASW